MCLRRPPEAAASWAESVDPAVKRCQAQLRPRETWGREVESWSLVQNGWPKLAPAPEPMLSGGKRDQAFHVLADGFFESIAAVRAFHSLEVTGSCSLPNAKGVPSPSESLPWELRRFSSTQAVPVTGSPSLTHTRLTPRGGENESL